MLKRPNQLPFRRKVDPPVDPAACDMNACPKCGSAVQRSRAHTSLESIRKRFTRKRLHRCLTCGWRGWMIWTRRARGADGWTIQRNAPDLASINAALAEAAGNADARDQPREAV